MKRSGSKKTDRIRSMAITVICVTLLFVLFTVPINIYVPISHVLSHDTHAHCHDLLFAILNNMVNANHSINFFVYLLTNSKFRSEFKACVTCATYALKNQSKTVTSRTT